MRNSRPMSTNLQDTFAEKPLPPSSLNIPLAMSTQTFHRKPATHNGRDTTIDQPTPYPSKLNPRPSVQGGTSIVYTQEC